MSAFDPLRTLETRMDGLAASVCPNEADASHEPLFADGSRFSHVRPGPEGRLKVIANERADEERINASDPCQRRDGDMWEILRWPESATLLNGSRG